MRGYELEAIFGEYERVLGLQWPVKYYLQPNAPTCQILSDANSKEHRVYVNGTTYGNMDIMISDVVHELGHAHLAEHIDPTFATIFFTDKWNKFSRENPEEFFRLMQELRFSWSHVDIWVNDLRHKHWPEFTLMDSTTFIQGLKFMIQTKDISFLEDPGILLGIIQCQAEMMRHGLAELPTPFSLLMDSGMDIDSQINVVVEYFETLPALKFRLKKDLRLLEDSVKRMSQELHFSIAPRLVREKGRWVWSLD